VIGPVVAALGGAVFAVGLVVSGMTDPAKILGFLDVAGGAWDPSLAFVMVGAIGVFLPAHRWSLGWARPRAAATFRCPLATRLDARLLGGAALFGIGWGASGFCPGPALVSLGGLRLETIGFVAAMLVGIAAFRRPD
jgi:hypothetical protein